MNIANELTRSILTRIGSTMAPVPADENIPRCRTICAEDDDFLALLGTENGRGIASMLAAYPHFYRWKDITGVIVYPDDGDGPCYLLGA
jgi:hypothetical protein